MAAASSEVGDPTRHTNVRVRGLAAIACILALLLAGGADVAPSDGSHRAMSRLLVALSPGASPWQLPGVKTARLLDRRLNAYAVSLPAGSAARLQSSAHLIGAQSDWLARPTAETAVCADPPTEPDYLLPTIDATHVQSPPTTPAIAILDGGLDDSLSQFSGRIRGAYDVVAHSADVTDLNGHGTAVAAVAAAAGANPGVSPTSPVIPIKVFAPDGTATAADIVSGIAAAETAGARVINISAAGQLPSIAPQDNRVVSMALDAAFSRGILIVASSGNDGSGVPNAPAAYPHVLSVGAIGATGRVATFSNYGRTVDLVAPGVQLATPAPQRVCASRYQLVDGTSFSAPAVAGAAALLQSLRPTLSVEQQFALLRSSARVLGTRWNPYTGFGVLDVGAALAAQAPPRATQPEVNDDVYWLTGANAAAHPVLLRNARRAAVSGTLDTLKDPTDVFRVRLTRGERMRVTASTSAGVRVRIALWDPATGPFDISANSPRHRLAAATGSVRAAVAIRAARTGIYYTSITGTRTVVGGSQYSLRLEGG